MSSEARQVSRHIECSLEVVIEAAASPQLASVHTAELDLQTSLKQQQRLRLSLVHGNHDRGLLRARISERLAVVVDARCVTIFSFPDVYNSRREAASMKQRTACDAKTCSHRPLR